MGTEEDFLRFANDPRLWNALGGPQRVLQGMTSTLDQCREVFYGFEEKIDLVVTSSLGLAISTLAESRGIPRLTLHLQPCCVLSEYELPLFTEGLGWLDAAPRWFRRMVIHLVDLALWPQALRPLNKFREKLGLTPLKSFYHEGLHGADGEALLYPAWFAAPQPDWPVRARQFSFPLSPVESSNPLSRELEDFLSHGEPPLVWTHGSANFHMEDFQAIAIAASGILGSRAILVSLKAPSQPLPSNMIHISHVAFETLFPRCRAAIHHGGIGTTAKAIAAGIPQLIIPRSHDQPDNGARIARLGLGAMLSYRRLTPEGAPQVLGKMLSSEAVREACLKYQSQLLDENPLPVLCTWAEELASSR